MNTLSCGVCPLSRVCGECGVELSCVCAALTSVTHPALNLTIHTRKKKARCVSTGMGRKVSTQSWGTD
eukprot:5361348-Prymnesium_polylepis.1